MAYKTREILLGETQKPIMGNKTLEQNRPYSTIEYPKDQLGGDRYPYYTVFYINENSKSKLVAKDDSNTQGIVESKRTGTAVSQSIDKSYVAETIKSTSNAAIGGYNKVVGAFEGSPFKLSKAKEMESFEFTSGTKRLKYAICLPMPAKVRANYDADYSASEAIGAMGATVLAAINPNGDMTETALQGLAPVAVGTGIKKIGTYIPGINAREVGDSASKITKNIIQKFTGKVINKRQEQLFNNMKFRSHQFSYIFIPRNEQESLNINEIIRLFKTHMHPELNGSSGGSSLLITPAEFDIEFMHKEAENVSLSRITTCALQSIDVNYTQIGEFIAFDGTDNPVAIGLDMTFVELEPLTRNMVQDGGY